VSDQHTCSNGGVCVEVCPDDGKNRVVSAQATYTSGGSAVQQLLQPGTEQESCHARLGGLTEGHAHSMELRPLQGSDSTYERGEI